MDTNAILHGVNSITGIAEQITSTANMLRLINVTDTANIGNDRYGLSSRKRVSIYGYNGDIDNTVRDLWIGPTEKYVFPPTPIQMRITSTSAADASTGTGIRAVRLYYLDTDYIAREETITLTGLTPVNTVATNILRVNFMHAMSVGTGGSAAGIISLTNMTSTVSYALIGVGFTTHRTGVYTVPAGNTLYATDWQGSSGSAAGNHFTRIIVAVEQYEGVPTPGVPITHAEIGTQDGGMAVTMATPMKVSEKLSIRLAAVSDGASANVMAMGYIVGYLEVN